MYVCIEVFLRGIAHGEGRSNWAKGRDPSVSWVQYPNPVVPTAPRHARWNILVHFRAFSVPTLLWAAKGVLCPHVGGTETHWAHECVRGYGITDPIRSEADIPTDHLTVYASFTMSRVPQYKIENYAYYHETPEGDTKFGTWLMKQNWSGLFAVRDIDRKVKVLHDLFGEATEYSYKWKTRKKKSSKPVWMTDGIRDMIKKRRKLFKKLK